MGILDKFFGPPNIEKLVAKGDGKGLAKALRHKDSDIRRKAAQALKEGAALVEASLRQPEAGQELGELLKHIGGGRIADAQDFMPIRIRCRDKVSGSTQQPETMPFVHHAWHYQRASYTALEAVCGVIYGSV